MQIKLLEHMLNLDLYLCLNVLQFHGNNRSRAMKKDGTDYFDYFQIILSVMQVLWIVLF